MKSCRGATPSSRGFFVANVEGTFRRTIAEQWIPASTTTKPSADRACFGVGNREGAHGSRSTRAQ